MKKIEVKELKGAQLALWAARANGHETRKNIKLFTDGTCLYRDLGSGATPYPFRPDSTFDDTAGLVYEMMHAGAIHLDATGAALSVPGWGTIGYEGCPIEAATRCYVAWKLGEVIETEEDRRGTV